ncbi:ATP-binding protein [Sulfobacillus sp. hq2]|uniref:ATP-binding protein n=1 Tax=Sulfobacillus sp. hq2 TaxID=2039167 RepID=UPI000CD13500|nr:ATP-binding protein [Sulfobacillus sp. hq2]POB12215.1 AAA family ATPase [Sulfobacillus sp. hq2]
MTNPFTPAVKHRHFLRMALVGPAGTGKTYTALRLAQGLGARIAVVDTEHDSASLYAPLFAFDVLPLGSFAPQAYLDAIAAARTYGYDVLILDSLSHAWAGKDGILERQAKAAGPDQWGNDRLAWRAVTAEHNALIEAIMQAPLHVLVTLRSRVDYVVETDAQGKVTVRKVGLRPIQQDGLEFDLDVVGTLDEDHTLTITKTRCAALSRGVFPEPGAEVATLLRTWLQDGADPLVDDAAMQTLGAWVKAHPVSVPELMRRINGILHTTYQNPRELTQPEFTRVMAALTQDTPADPAASA